MSAATEPLCGSSADSRYCPQFWELTTEVDRLTTEVKRLQGVVREVLENTGLDDDEQAEFLARAGIHGDDGDDAEDPS